MLFREQPVETMRKLLPDTKISQKYTIYRVLSILAATALFLFALYFAGHAFKVAGGDIARSILTATYNPFISLFIGLLVTAIIQSSSTSTSMIVAAVATGSLDFANAVPMIMGANIGTTLTSTMVSIGYITKRKEFRKAIAAGTQHDIFNILATAILLPLELYYNFLSNLAIRITSYIAPFDSADAADRFTYGFWGESALFRWFFSTTDNTLIPLLVSFVLLIIAIKLLSRLFYDTLIGNVKNNLQRLIFSSPLKSFIWGTVLTATVQSSSVTTPLAVPLVATGKISLKQSFPYIMGANLGTTITALIAALYHSQEAVSIAMVHVLFNAIGVLIFFPLSSIRKLPLRLASWLGRLTLHHRLVGFAYILLTFFLIPFALIYFNKDFVSLNKGGEKPLQEDSRAAKLPQYSIKKCEQAFYSGKV
jgi:sodium-dependent phosphate cotransporter